jgi:hypothetical protein
MLPFVGAQRLLLVALDDGRILIHRDDTLLRTTTGELPDRSAKPSSSHRCARSSTQFPSTAFSTTGLSTIVASS